MCTWRQEVEIVLYVYMVTGSKDNFGMVTGSGYCIHLMKLIAMDTYSLTYITSGPLAIPTDLYIYMAGLSAL